MEPFFIISSFLLCSGEVTSAKLSKQIYRVLKIYIIWSILYIPLVLKNWVQSDFSWKTDVLLYIRDFLFIGSYYHLWFLPALAFALWLVRKSQVSKIKFLSGLLLCVVGLAFESYWFILSGNDSIEYIRYCYKSVFVTTRNGLFIGVPCVIIGQHLAFHKNTILNKVFKYRNFILCAVLAIGCLLVGESFIINQIALREVNNLLIFSIPLALVVVSVSLSLKIVHL
ncbi:acyltransferase family protein [Enterococcus sp. S109_ASV_20]|uniref:acyltransferase family protein n=1 Tax=Enterococcus sp. S109_ASV_20 TaxID=2846987 RepID=UPI0031F63944